MRPTDAEIKKEIATLTGALNNLLSEADARGICINVETNKSPGCPPRVDVWVRI
jgi:hypothetical protein